MQEKNHAGQEAIDGARDLVVLKLQDMYEVVTRDMMSDSMRYILIFLVRRNAFLYLFKRICLESIGHFQVLECFY